MQVFGLCVCMCSSCYHLLSFFNNRIVGGGLAPRGIWGRVQGMGLVQGVTTSGLVCGNSKPTAGRKIIFAITEHKAEYGVSRLPLLAPAPNKKGTMSH